LLNSRIRSPRKPTLGVPMPATVDVSRGTKAAQEVHGMSMRRQCRRLASRAVRRHGIREEIGSAHSDRFLKTRQATGRRGEEHGQNPDSPDGKADDVSGRCANLLGI
jgi:hypothetical protein